MALETSWLDLCFVEKILRKSENDDSIKVMNIVSKPATSKGDNYTSDMIRITAEYLHNSKIKETKSIIIKLTPVDGVRQKIVTQAGLFHTEMSMMSDTLDKMNKLLGPKHRLSAKILYVQNGNPMLLVFEDLASLSFRMADRLSGLDLDHSLLAFRGLARFHAASVVLCEKNPKQKEMYSKGMFYNQHSPEMKSFFIMGAKTLADEIANWPEAKKYSEKVSKLSDHMYQIGIDAHVLCEDEFNVINHGDCHVNNMLFKYDNNGKPTDQIFVDFQMCIYASAALDLIYLLNSSISFDVIEHKTDILLNEYLHTLSTTMKQLNCKTQPPTMKELKASIKRKASYGMLICFTILPFMLISKAEAKDLDEVLGSSTFMHPGLKKMTLETSWLDACFVEKILRKSENDDSIKVMNIVSKPAIRKGDNYTSDIIRIIAEYSRNSKIKEKKSIIVKLCPVDGVRQRIVTQAGLFHTEMSMLSDTLDKMNKLLGPKYRLSPKILYGQIENPTLLVIEDLASLGFRMADRLSGLDLDHSLLAFRVLARFHAASVVLCEKNPKQKEMYSKGMFYNQHSPEMKSFFIMGAKTLADEIANWPEAKKYSEKVSKLSDHMYQIGIDAYILCEDEFNVIIHGDCHVNNILFKYDNNGKPTDQIFVDFQLCTYASAALDLIYLLNSSISFDVIEHKTDILLNEYLHTLSTTMKQLNCKTQPPTMKELKASIKRKASFGMLVSFIILPLLLCCKSEAKDFNEILGGTTFMHSGLKSESLKKILIKRLPLYDEWGLLDI
ncbi:PREDICTED: uncharacterized protein LOC108747813 [Trachymyrmex septentrionalis]|uniref:uncharacterized protein LOC108747813 n=1 Tax=Trachymyrmex septentrionalis TaxID=34720 RepID=UPI00084F3056|nr:PREDICTED: uncharacterized protein LOC108747813 [Trachymyrmex septentrionalis]XP_018341125.1 PREDICTED: uncharacterized protein LOC108747813 [Trachymyrmex septentrionalis]